MRSKARSAFVAACLSLAALGGASSAQGAFPGQGFLPDNRAWEMVSPPDKNGGYVVPDSRRTRAALDGDSVGFISLTAFGDAIGTANAVDYMARRSTDPDPGHNGWLTHALTPKGDSKTLVGALSAIDPNYSGEYSPDMGRGVTSALSPLTADPWTAGALNLYLRTDLATSGPGSYELITACPRCELTKQPLPPLPGDTGVFRLRPELAGASPDLSHVVFESEQQLTLDTPATIALRLYEWQEGEVRLAGRIPTGTAIECDDDFETATPACAAAAISGGGQGLSLNRLTPHTVSDGSDGHHRVFFTMPSDDGTGSKNTPGAPGNVYARTDGVATAKLNTSERTVTPADAFAPARYWDATPDGTRVLFSTTQALTDDAISNTDSKLYMYDTTRPASESDNLTLISVDSELKDGGDVIGAIGLGEDASYVYFITEGQLVSGGSFLNGKMINVWHEGEVRFVAPLLPNTSIGFEEALSVSVDTVIYIRQARVTPAGRGLLFSAIDGSKLLGNDHGKCAPAPNTGCRELYLYSADTDSLECVSCHPDGTPSKGGSTTDVREFYSAAFPGKHETRALTPDGRYIFFSTANKLVPEDTNGTTDAYRYDTTTNEARLLSSGEDGSPSWFLDASADASDAFFVTRERLSRWDVDNDFDIYDARVGGGFPEPPLPPPGCLGDACQPAPLLLNDPTPASASFQGPGDASVPKPNGRCPKGQRKVKVKGGKSRCMKPKQGKRTTGKDRRAAR